MDNDSPSNIKNTGRFPIKTIIIIGNITLISLDKSIVTRLGITENTLFQEEPNDDGIYLRIVRKDVTLRP